jgi:hypothetical protein
MDLLSKNRPWFRSFRCNPFNSTPIAGKTATERGFRSVQKRFETFQSVLCGTGMVPGYINGLDSILQRKIRSIFAVILCRVGLIVKDKNRTKTDKEENSGKQILPLINADRHCPQNAKFGRSGNPGRGAEPCSMPFSGLFTEWILCLRQGDNDSTRNNEAPAHENRWRRCLSEYKPREDLCEDKEEDNIQPEQLSKVPGWRVHGPAISEENDRRSNKKSDPIPKSTRMKTDAHEGVPAGFKSRCKD